VKKVTFLCLLGLPSKTGHKVGRDGYSRRYITPCNLTKILTTKPLGNTRNSKKISTIQRLPLEGRLQGYKEKSRKK